ncbi:putative uncharacterized protein [Blautia hydrogenotrophica CAG:147]|uniref:DUF3786 domain-containing protein n=1 Tax=Blautia hydrogenotrophica TaxID=53443 RepID=UPI00033AA103|nr:DUF3786 domain-containing protein [Blautia hydrogenotrophica]CCX59449.1 putative uncharacterized protein [Blautia hydrogenotrophica CAG:147]
MNSNAQGQSQRAYLEMLKIAQGRLKGRSAEEISEKTGLIYWKEDRVFQTASMNQEYEISCTDFLCRQKIDQWFHLVLLHYMDLGDGTPVSKELITFGEMKDGLIRGTKYDRTMDQEIKKFLKDKEPEQVKAVWKKLGAEFVSSRADLCAVFPFLPRFPLIVNVWFADDEFEATGKMLLSRTADRYLTVEDAVIVGDIVLNRWKEAWEDYEHQEITVL